MRSAHLRPRRQPINTRLVKLVGGPPSRKSHPSPRDWSGAEREGRDHLKLWVASPDPAGELEGACAVSGVSAPGRPAGSASAPENKLGKGGQEGYFCARASAPLVARVPGGCSHPAGRSNPQRRVVETPWGSLVSGRLLPASTLGCCSLQEWPSTTCRLSVRLRLLFTK